MKEGAGEYGMVGRAERTQRETNMKQKKNERCISLGHTLSESNGISIIQTIRRDQRVTEKGGNTHTQVNIARTGGETWFVSKSTHIYTS